MAAHRAGIQTIIVPRRNQKDMVEVPKKVQRDLTFVFVDRMDEVLPVALAAEPVNSPRRGKKQRIANSE